MRNRLIAGLVMLAAVSGSVSAQAASGSEMKWSIAGGVAQPVGDWSKVAKLGFGAGISADWMLNTDWSIRGTLDYYTFAPKIGSGNVNIYGLSGNFVYHDASSKLGYSIGAGYSKPSCTGCDGKPSLNLLASYQLDAAKQWSLEGGLTTVFTSGSNTMWVPIGVRYTF